MALTNPLLPSIYITSMTSPLSLHSKKRIRLHVFERRKIQCGTIIQFLQLKPRNQDSLSGESFQKSGKKVSEIIGNTLPSTTAILVFFCHCDCYCFRYSVWNHFSCTRDTWIDRLIALVSTLGMSILVFQCHFVLPGYLVLYCTNIQT
jgi:peptide/nickel transport system permease protein